MTDPARAPVVYFVKIGRKAIKIGLTTDLRGRLASFRTATLEDIQVLATFPGGRKLEKYLHKLFADCRIRNEFFFGMTYTFLSFWIELKRIRSMP